MAKTILFIEDESMLQKTFNDFLTQEGYTMLSAFDGEVGIKLAKEKKPDLILLDLILPRVDGFTALQSLKADATTKNIPVIIVTNLEGMQEVEKALELGAMTYLVKSNYTLEDILRKVRQFIGDSSQ